MPMVSLSQQLRMQLPEAKAKLLLKAIKPPQPQSPKILHKPKPRLRKKIKFNQDKTQRQLLLPETWFKIVNKSSTPSHLHQRLGTEPLGLLLYETLSAAT